LEGILSLSFAADGRWLAAMAERGIVWLWDLNHPGASPLVFLDRGPNASDLAIDPEGQRLVIADSAGTVRMWDLARPGSGPVVLPAPEAGVRAVAFVPDGRLVSAGTGSLVRLWEFDSPELGVRLLRYAEGFAVITAAAFAADGGYLVANADARVWVWDLGQLRTNLDMHRLSDSGYGFNDHIAFANGRLAAGGPDGIVRLWDLARPEADPVKFRHHVEPGTPSDDAAVTAVALAPDGHRLVSAGQDGIVRLWDLARPEADPVVHRIGESGLTSVASAAFSPDNRRVLLATTERTIWSWDLSRPEAPPVVLHRLERSVPAQLSGFVAIAADGRTLAAVGLDGTVWLWDLTRPEADPVGFRADDTPVRFVALAHNGSFLAAADGTLWLRPARTETLADLVCRRVWRNLTLEE
jgi:WD40 repeat protein